MSNQLVKAWLDARPTILVCLKEESDIDEAVSIKFVWQSGEYGYEWAYEFIDSGWTDEREAYVESIVSYMKDTLDVDTETRGYPQIFAMVLKERGGMK
jgi:hypothetical protein